MEVTQVLGSQQGRHLLALHSTGRLTCYPFDEMPGSLPPKTLPPATCPHTCVHSNTHPSTYQRWGGQACLLPFRSDFVRPSQNFLSNSNVPQPCPNTQVAAGSPAPNQLSWQPTTERHSRKTSHTSRELSLPLERIDYHMSTYQMNREDTRRTWTAKF